MNIISKNCRYSDSKDKKLPVNSYVVKYVSKEDVCYDIVQSNAMVEIFDHYHDLYGGKNIKSIEWTSGTVNPKVYGYEPKKKKK